MQYWELGVPVVTQTVEDSLSYSQSHKIAINVINRLGDYTAKKKQTT